MSEGLAPRQFAFGSPAVCQQPFVFDGKDFEPGASFSYEGLERYQVHGLWSASLIDFVATPVPELSKAQRRKQR